MFLSMLQLNGLPSWMQERAHESFAKHTEDNEVVLL